MLFVLQLLLVGQANAVSSSNSYSINEDQIGGVGDLNSASTSFKTDGTDNLGSTLGDTAIGNSSSTNFQTNSGFNTSESPALTFIVNSTTVNFGVLSSGAARTGTATFSVKNYTSYGYAVQTVGIAPTSGGRTITPMSSGASVIGTEQFGINLVANTTPISQGTNAAQIPDSTFSFGIAAANYNVSNSYRYVSGETIASAPKSSGETDYTISYIVNVANDTPAGQYLMNQSLICTGTY